MSTPVPVLAPDATLAVVDYLQAVLPGRGESYAQGVLVGTTVPAVRASRMVMVRRDGGRQVGIFDAARITLNVWAKSEQNANDLSRLVVALMLAAPDGAPIVSVSHESGPSPVPDDSGDQRRLLVFTVRTRGEQL